MIQYYPEKRILTGPSRSSLDRRLLLRQYEDFFSGNEIIPIDFININITGGCNFRCKICHTWKDTKSWLSYGSCRRFLETISPFAKKRGVTLVFAGGEPLMHADLSRMIRLSDSYGYRTSIITNSWLLSERRINELLDAGLKTIMISLDSGVEEIHDNIRGVKGSYKKIMNAIEYLAGLKNSCGGKEFTFGINATVTKLNISTLPSLVRFVSDNMIDHIQFQAVTQVFNTSPEKEWFRDPRYAFLWPDDKEEVEDIYAELIRMRNKGHNIVNSPRNLSVQRDYFLNPYSPAKHSLCGFFKSIFVEVNGNISMCLLDKPIGNANDTQVSRDLLRRMIPQEQRKIMSCIRKNCHYDLNCRFN